MKKSIWFKAAHSFAALLSLACCFSTRAQAQCTPETLSPPTPGFTYEVIDEADVTRIRFSLNHSSTQKGVLGFQLVLQLSSDLQDVSAVEYDLQGAWPFASASMSVDMDYDASAHQLLWEVIRTDCQGATGSGFVGELRIFRGTGCSTPIQSLIESIVMVDNVDAG
jgi:hypothetical protein